MAYNLKWDAAHDEAILALALLMGGFLCWFYFSHSSWLKGRLERRFGPEQGQVYKVLLRRVLGFALFGLLPALVLFATQPYGWADYGVSAVFSAEAAYWALGLSTLLALGASFSARHPENLAAYPEIRLAQWRRKDLSLSLLSWALYMIGYEFAFRGYLLFASARAFGPWPAIAISTVLYSLAHLPKNRRETIGAIPLGILLCIITFRTGSILVPIIVHTVMALSNNWFSLKHHPEMSLVVSRKPQPRGLSGQG